MKNANIKLLISAGLFLVMLQPNTVNAQWSLTGNAGTTPGTNFLGTTDTKALYFKTKNVTRMVINSSGRVGIGTSSPAHKLDVRGNLWLGTQQSSSGFTTIEDALYLGSPRKYLSNTLGASVDGSVDWINLMAHPLSSGIIFGTSGPSDTDPHSSPTPLMTIRSNGNVAIGTSTPANGYKLTVAGKIICTELKVQLQPFPDYVFEAGYPLKSIPEVDEHIQLHGHLPGMPSAEEVESAGMSVGEMTGKVVEKVEENTLYIIQLYKENQQLKAALEEMQKQIDDLKK